MRTEDPASTVHTQTTAATTDRRDESRPKPADDDPRLPHRSAAAIWLALAELRSTLEPGARVLALGAEATKYMFGGFSYVHG